MKVTKLVPAAAMGLVVGFSPFAHAQKMDMSEHGVMTMDHDKDGMISKSEFMKRMEQHWNEMAAKHKGGKVTPKEAAAVKLTPKEGAELVKHIEEMNRQTPP